VVPRKGAQEEANFRLLLAISWLGSRDGIDCAEDYCAQLGIFRSSRSCSLVATKSKSRSKHGGRRTALLLHECVSFACFVIFVVSWPIR
jgi:hypothetical protein